MFSLSFFAASVQFSPFQVPAVWWESPANDANFESDPLYHLGSDARGVGPSSLSLPPRFASLSLLSVTASVPTPTLSCDQSVDVFYDNVVKSCRVGLCSSCFSTDCGVLIRLASYHGVSVQADLMVDQLRHMVLRHLLNGDCFRTAHRNGMLPRGCRCDAQCSQLAASFPSATDMSLAFIHRVVDDINSDQKLMIKKISTIASAFAKECYDGVSFSTPSNAKRDAMRLFTQVLRTSSLDETTNVIPSNLEKMSRFELQSFASSHSIMFDRQTSVSALRDLILQHGLSSCCLQNINTNNWDASPSGCARCISKFLSTGQSADAACFVVYELSHHSQTMSLKPLRHVLTHLAVPFAATDTVNQLRRRLALYVSRMQKTHSGDGVDKSWDAVFAELVSTRENWPQLISPLVKQSIREDFIKLTSASTLKTGVCAACAQSCPCRLLETIRPSSIDLNLLRRPDAFDVDEMVVEPWLCNSVSAPIFPFRDGPLADILLDPKGVNGQGSETELTVCKSCLSSLRCGRIPDFALSNHMFIGDVPSELKDLTIVKESMIALCRTKCCILRLKADGNNHATPTAQRALKGNLIIYPQHPSDVAKKLPLSVEEITSPICVLFVGSNPPSNEWLRTKAKPLAICAHKVRAALQWLKAHNHLYKDIEIDDSVILQLQSNPVLPFHIEHINSSHATDASTSGYDPSCEDNTSHSANSTICSDPLGTMFPAPPPDPDVSFPSVVIREIENTVSSSQMAAAAICHLKKKGGGYLQIPHDSQPANEFFNTELFPKMYPTLFPYGIGGFEDVNHRVKVSLRRHVKHMFLLHDRRFQEHYSFLFAAFNILQ